MGRMKELAYDALLAEDEEAFIASLADQHEAMEEYFAMMEEQLLQREMNKEGENK